MLLFCILLLYQWFRLVEETLDSYTAGICTAALGLLPMVLLFEKSVMLEVPSLALGVAAIRHWIGYLEKNHEDRSIDLDSAWRVGWREALSPACEKGPLRNCPLVIPSALAKN